LFSGHKAFFMYNDVYFDGTNSIPHPCEVSVDENIIIIRYPDNDGHFIQVEWDKKNIEKIENGSEQGIVIFYGHFPRQILELRTPVWVDSLMKSQHLTSRFYHSMRTKGIKIIIPTLIACLSILIALYMWVLPNIASSVARSLPESFDEKLGDNILASTLSRYATDTFATTKVQQFADSMHLSDKRKITVTVVNSSILNAFAIPNGHIIVFSALLDTLDQPAELAGLLAHEASHVYLRHSTQTLFRNLAGYMVVSLLVGDVSGISAVMVQNAQNLQNFSHSRKFEAEADHNGIKILHDNNLSADGMLRLLNKLNSKTRGKIPEWLSTHPSTLRRMDEAYHEKNKEQKVKGNPALDEIWKELRNGN
jgi:beta-barrel assembly-enhancing protease